MYIQFFCQKVFSFPAPPSRPVPSPPFGSEDRRALASRSFFPAGPPCPRTSVGASGSSAGAVL